MDMTHFQVAKTCFIIHLAKFLDIILNGRVGAFYKCFRHSIDVKIGEPYNLQHRRPQTED